MVATGLILASLCAFALANPLGRRAMKVHESRTSVPEGFTKQGPAPASTVLNMRVALKQADSAGLEAATLAVSTPGNARFNKHLSQDEVRLPHCSGGQSRH